MMAHRAAIFRARGCRCVREPIEKPEMAPPAEAPERKEHGHGE